MKSIATICALLAALACGLPEAAAQQYPTKPIRGIAPMAPGGFGDILLRAIGAELAKSLGQPFVVENRGGANTVLAGDACAKAAADGHTLCMLTIDTLSFNPFLYKKLPYDAEQDFEPIIHLVYLTEGLMVNPSLKLNTLAELIALARAKPGSLNYGSISNNMVLFMETFTRGTGTDIRTIPYKGPAEAVKALLAGEVQVGVFGIGNLIGHLKSGKIKLLAVDGSSRSVLFPEVPTLEEAGYRGVPIRIWLGIVGPAGTPKPIVAKLNAEIARIAGEAAFKERYITAQGLEAVLDSPAHFAQFLKDDRQRAEKLVRGSSLRPE